MTNPTAWNDGTAGDTPELFEKPPFWDDLDKTGQKFWASEDFFTMRRGLADHVDVSSEDFAEQLTTHMTTGLANVRILEGASSLLTTQAKAIMGSSPLIQAVGKIFGVPNTETYDKVEVGGLMFSAAVIQDQREHCLDLLRLMRIWAHGQLGTAASDELVEKAIVASQLHFHDPGDGDTSFKDAL